MHIIVLGMHRSGTSTVTRLINLMGAHVGSDAELIAANEENPKGFWERQDVIDCNDALLAHHGSSWYDLTQWPLRGDETAPALPEALQAEMQAVLARLNSPAVIKDPRLCHTLPYWRAHLRQPVYVVVHRDPLEIARSLQKRNELPMIHGLALWECAVVGIFNGIDPARTIFIHYHDIIERPVATTRHLYESLIRLGVDGMERPGEAAVTDFVEPALYRSRSQDITPQEMMTTYQQALNERLVSERLDEKAALAISPHAREIMQVMAREYTERLAMHSQQEVLDRAMTTINEQEARIGELLEQTHLLEHERNALTDHISTIEPLAHECEQIKRTRWWRLRARILALKARLSF